MILHKGKYARFVFALSILTLIFIISPQTADANIYASGQCTYHVWQRVYDVLGISLTNWGDAADWDNTAASLSYLVDSNPTTYSILVEERTAEMPRGHVAFIETVENGYAYYTDNYGSSRFKLSNWESDRTNKPVGKNGRHIIHLTSGSERVNIHSGIYVIHSAWNDNLCLDITGNQTTNDANIQLYHRVTTDNVQKFRIIKWNDDYYCIQSIYNGLWLDVASPFEDNSNVKLYYDHSAAENHWIFEEADGGYLYIRNERGNYLDVYADDAVDGRNIQAYHFVGNNSQKWRLEEVTDYYDLPEGTYSICSAINEDYRFDITGDQKENDANIQLYEKSYTDVQKFKFIKQGSFYYVQSVYNSLWLDIKTPITNKSNVKLYENNVAAENQWVLEDAGDGYVYIRSNADYYLDVEGDKAENGANIQVYHFVGNNSQKWKINEYDFIISYDANGGIGAPKTDWKQYGIGRVISDEIPEKDGYVFGGWKTSVCGEELLLMPNEVYYYDADTTLVAQWIAVTELQLPDEMTSIEAEAFNGIKASRIVIPSQVSYIGESAFANNDNLCEVYIYSESVSFGSDVFNNCPRLIIHGRQNSTAETYAALNRIPFFIIVD